MRRIKLGFAAALCTLWIVPQLLGCADSADDASKDLDGSVPDEPSSVKLVRSSLSADNTPDISDADYAKFISNINGFGLDLGREIATANALTESNLVCSPLSATVALAMAYAGARTQTAAEMKTVLGDTFSDDTYHVACNRLTRELKSRVISDPKKPWKITLDLTDGLFAERTLNLESPFLDVLARDYDTGVRTVDFVEQPEAARATINAWVGDQTHDKIKDLLTPSSITSATRLVLVNALYFYGTWATPFPVENTRDAAFQPLAGAAVQVPTMSATYETAYAAASDYQIAELPYSGEQLRMTIVLPAAGKLEAVRAHVSSAWLDKAVSSLSTANLAIQLPKFKIKVGPMKLNDALQALGMRQMFAHGEADFSGITHDEKLEVSDVLQEAFVAVDTAGTEAAAATAVVFADASVELAETPTPFVVNRPFLFFIRDASGAVLFSGQVVNPAQ